MRYLPYILALATLSTACASMRTEVAHLAADPNVLQTAETLTATVFAVEQPALNAAVSVLPAETQALAQAAYSALQKGIDEAMTKGVGILAASDKAAASSVVVAMSKASDTLHAAIHTSEAVLAAPLNAVSPNLVLPTDPNAVLVTSPNVLLIVADPNLINP